MAIAVRQKILLVDDDQDFLEVYLEILKRLPSQPEIHTASTGARALALLESERFTVLIIDLQMPKMDGLQVLAIARRKYPQLRIVVLTAVSDEQFRARAYGMGVDQFWLKPENDRQVQQFLDSLEVLLQYESQGGFRGVQSKSLVDIIQLECMSQSSAVLKISNGLLEGKIWFQGGAVIDAEAQELSGEAAFHRIFSWKTGSFELLPPDPARTRKIFQSYQGLLLESAQAVDEAGQAKEPGEGADAPRPSVSFIADMTQFPDMQFVLTLAAAPKYDVDSWGLENPEVVADWTQKTLQGFQELGERLQAGQLQRVIGLGSPSHLAMMECAKGALCLGLRSSLRVEQVRETLKNVLAKWVS